MKIKLIAYCLLMSSALQGMDNEKITQVGNAFAHLFSSANIDSSKRTQFSTVAINIYSEDPQCGSMYSQSKKGLEAAGTMIPESRHPQYGILFANNKRGKQSSYAFSFSDGKWQKNPKLDVNYNLFDNHMYPSSPNSATVYNISHSDSDKENNVSPDSHIAWIKNFIERKQNIPLVINIQDALWPTYSPLITNVINKLNINPPIFDHRLETRFALANEGKAKCQHCFISENNTFDNLYQESSTALKTLSNYIGSGNIIYGLDALLFCADKNENIILTRHHKTIDEQYKIETLNDLTEEIQKSCSFTAFIITNPSDISLYNDFLSMALNNNGPIVLIMSKELIDTEELNKINTKLQDLWFNANMKTIFIEGAPYFLNTTAQSVKKIDMDEPKIIKTPRSYTFYYGGLALLILGFLYYKYAAK